MSSGFAYSGVRTRLALYTFPFTHCHLSHNSRFTGRGMSSVFRRDECCFRPLLLSFDIYVPCHRPPPLRLSDDNAGSDVIVMILSVLTESRSPNKGRSAE